MKFYIQVLKMLINKFILRKDNGTVIKEFACKMGIVYIKFAQILATQNYGNLFTEEDREMLASICDDCNPIDFSKIKEILKEEYGDRYYKFFSSINRKPLGSASISQVHRAVLRTGEVVALKVKRRDITEDMEREIKRLKRIIHLFGRIVKFGNYTGGDQALDLYLGWIKDETDFNLEKKNIQTYQDFANNVNGRIAGMKDIRVPKLYEEYSTDNVIVMEFIPDKTINKLELNEENKHRTVEALNSYLKLSFWAMFHGEPVVFHGDPHSGNIYLDKDGNIGFLDMGLLFCLSPEDAELTRKFFLTAYTGNYEKLYDMLSFYGNLTEEQGIHFKEDCRKYTRDVKIKDVTFYFTDMINVCTKYEFVPPNFLFCMAKAFICLNGMNKFTGNPVSAMELLQEQTMEYLVTRSIRDYQHVMMDGVFVAPEMLSNTIKDGVVSALVKALASNACLKEDVRESVLNLQEMLDLLKMI